MRNLTLASIALGALIAVIALRPNPTDGLAPAPLAQPGISSGSGALEALGGAKAQADRREVEAADSKPTALGTGFRLLVRTGLPGRFRELGDPVRSLAFELRRKGQGPDSEPFFEGVSDESGECWVDVPGDAGVTFKKGAPQIIGRIVGPGYQHRTASALAPVAEGEAPVLPLSCRAGGTARGRVLDGAGKGVEATVSLNPWIAPNGVRKLGYGPRTKTSDLGLDAGQTMMSALGYGPTGKGLATTGRFELHFTGSITGALLATSPTLGSGALLELELDPLDPPQDLVIVLRGPGRIAGRVTDGSGNPAAALSILVLLAELDEPDGSFVLPEPAASDRRVEGKGNLWATLETDAQGRFAVHGLRPGAYVVRARVKAHGSYPKLLTPSPVPADGSKLELRLLRPHFLVQLRKPDGSPIERPADVKKSAWGSAYAFGGDAPSRWPSSVRVLLFEDAHLGPSPAPAERSLRGKPAGPGDFVFEAKEGRSYWIGAQGEGFDGSLSEVRFPVGGERQVLTLTAGPPIPMGEVEVRVFYGAEEFQGRGYTEREFRLALESLDHGGLLLEKASSVREYPLFFSAPVGRYRVVATGDSSMDTHHGTLFDERDLGRAEATVDITEGDPKQVELHLGPGARLKVSLSGSSSPQDLEALLEASPYFREADNQDQALSIAGKAALSIAQPGRRYEYVYRTEESAGSSAAGTHRTWDWPLGETHTSMMVSAGTFALVARMKGGRVAQREVVLVPGETLEVELVIGD